MEIKNIIEGHWNEIVGKNEILSDERLRICKQCPLYSSKFGGSCNNRLWLNPETGDISTEALDGYKRGCGCRLEAKTRLEHAACPLGKW